MTAEERDREALSAVMDGEAQELELRRTLDAVAGDASYSVIFPSGRQVSPSKNVIH